MPRRLNFQKIDKEFAYGSPVDPAKVFLGHRNLDKQQQLESIARQLLEIVDGSPLRDGVKDTPRRFARMWLDFLNYDAGKTDTIFKTMQADQMVIVKGMRVWSICEHHLLPFFCDISVGYLAKEKILGLSKFGRIAKKHAHKLQLQERLVNDIANEIMDVTGTKDVAVLAKGQHLCMITRGVEMPADMISSSLHGNFRSKPHVRAEFMSLVKD